MEEQYESDSKRDPSHITLGGNIELNGFQNADGGTRTIVMKMIGQFTKDAQAKCSKFEKIAVNLSGNYDVSVVLYDNGKEIIGKASSSNALIAFGDAIRDLQAKLA